MSDFEMLLTAWLQGGEIPADFKPTSNVEEYLLAILEGVDDSVTPESRADVLLDAIATKYAGYSDGLEELRDVSGMTAHHVPGGDTPEEVAAFLRAINGTALQDLAAKGATGVANNTTDILWAYRDLPSGGASLNIAYGNTAPEDTTKLWVKTAQPQNITIDYNPENTVETVYAQTAVLPDATSGLGIIGVVGKKCYIFRAGNNRAIDIYDTEAETFTLSPASFQYTQTACGVVGTKIYCFGGQATYPYMSAINVYDTENDTITTLPVTLPTAAAQIACGVVGKKCYLFGGFNGNTHQNTINVFDTETDTISTLSATLPTAARAIGVGVVGTKIYLFGGATSSGFIDTINVFDTETNTISTLSVTLPTAAGGIAVATFGTKCYLIGGGDNSVYDTILVFDTETETLTTLDETLPQTATGLACGVVGIDAYLFGGWTGTENTKNIYKFNITFPLAEGAVFVHEDMLRNKFTLVNEPTKVTVGVSAVSIGVADYAEPVEAYLHDGTQWRQI